MIAFLKGTVEEKEENAVLIECGGIGYRVYVPHRVLSELPGAGASVKLYTYFYVKEDNLALYGFRTKSEWRFFGMLIGVSGIGPKGGLAILSAMSEDELRFAILTDNAKAIAKAPGVGIKTAQKIVLELKDKLGADLLTGNLAEPETPAVQSTGNRVLEEAVEALTALGYNGTEAYKAVRQVDLSDEPSVETVLKRALRHMSFL